MLWASICASVLSLFAGIGVKWAVDRVWPPRVLEIPAEAQPHEPAPRLTVLDDTMDVLGAGVDAGIRIGRHARDRDRDRDRDREPSLFGGAVAIGNGWQTTDTVLDGPPEECPADWPDEAEAWATPMPGQP